METNELIELEYLEAMSEKVGEILDAHVVGKSYPVSQEEPFPQDLVEQVARVVIDVAVVNTAIRSFHVLPFVEGHLYMIDVQDKNQQTVASVIMTTTEVKSKLTVDSALVAFKSGAILYRHEEMISEALMNEGVTVEESHLV